MGASDRNLEGFWEWHYKNTLLPGTGLIWKHKKYQSNYAKDCALVSSVDMKAISQKCSHKYSYLCEYRPKRAGITICKTKFVRFYYSTIIMCIFFSMA